MRFYLFIMREMITHKAQYGLISIFDTDWIINDQFQKGKYWNESERYITYSLIIAKS